MGRALRVGVALRAVRARSWKEGSTRRKNGVVGRFAAGPSSETSLSSRARLVEPLVATGMIADVMWCGGVMKKDDNRTAASRMISTPRGLCANHNRTAALLQVSQPWHSGEEAATS